jgi:hypothetical protein
MRIPWEKFQAQISLDLSFIESQDVRLASFHFLGHMETCVLLQAIEGEVDVALAMIIGADSPPAQITDAIGTSSRSEKQVLPVEARTRPMIASGIAPQSVDQIRLIQ